MADVPANPRLHLHPGTNVKGRAAGAAWTYLLDSLEAGRVLCVGEPAAASRTTLERVAADLIVTDSDLSAVPPGPYDLVYLSGRPPASKATEALRVLAPLLRDDGRVYLEGRTGRALARAVGDVGLPEITAYRMTPPVGEMETAIPLGDTAVELWFRQHGIAAQRGRGPIARLRRALLRANAGARVGLFAAGATGSPAPRAHVPGYIQTIASRGGMDLSSYRFGLSARGRYGSRKVILYLFEPDRAAPELIVKITRDPSHNDRLLNEERALRYVSDSKLADHGTAPRVAFSGDHGGLRIVGETAIDGILLSTGAYRRATPLAYQWLIDLSARSAVRGAQNGAEIAAFLEAVVAGIARIYRLGARDMEGLREAARRLVDQRERLPGVFTHGDAAAWNALLTPDGRVAFLDWEAAEPKGLPLWDLFHFARSRVLAASRIRRLARRPESLLRSLFDDEDLRGAIREYLDRLDLDTVLVGPLFTLCWAHRALREVTRLEEAEVGEGHYIGLMRASLGADVDSAWSLWQRTRGRP
jgi:hypothetical protein